MKKAVLVVAGAISVLLSACNDGVPKVDDPHHPIDAAGNPISGTEFLKKYCAGKAANETCVKVETAVNADSSKGGLPKGW